MRLEYLGHDPSKHKTRSPPIGRISSVMDATQIAQFQELEDDEDVSWWLHDHNLFVNSICVCGQPSRIDTNLGCWENGCFLDFLHDTRTNVLYIEDPCDCLLRDNNVHVAHYPEVFKEDLVCAKCTLSLVQPLCDINFCLQINKE